MRNTNGFMVFPSWNAPAAAIAAFSWVCLFAPFAGAVMEPLPVAVYPDSEASSWFAIPAVEGLGEVSVKLALNATPSNTVWMAVGDDLDGDGVLSLAEAPVLFGWAFGAWFVRRASAWGWEEIAVPGGVGAHSLELVRRVDAGSDRAEGAVTAKLDNSELDFGGWLGDGKWLPAWVPGMSLVRVTSRGGGGSGVLLSVRVSATVLLLR